MRHHLFACFTITATALLFACNKDEEATIDSECGPYVNLNDEIDRGTLDSTGFADLLIGSWYRVADVEQYSGSRNTTECTEYVPDDSPERFEVREDFTYSYTRGDSTVNGTFSISPVYFGIIMPDGRDSLTDDLLFWEARTDRQDVYLPVAYYDRKYSGGPRSVADGFDFSVYYSTWYTRE